MKHCLVMLACLVSAFATACRSSGATGASMQARSNGRTADGTVILVRHAHKDAGASDQRDPPLDEVGVAQARLLARMTRDAGIDRVLVSNFKRTRQTAAAVAEMNPGVMVNESGDFNASTTNAEIAAKIRAAAASGRTVLVVAHSNQIPGILKELGGWSVPAMSESDYSFVFIATLRTDGSASLIRAGYPPLAG